MDRSAFLNARKRIGTGRHTTVRDNIFFGDVSGGTDAEMDIDVQVQVPTTAPLHKTAAAAAAVPKRASLSRKSLGRTGRRTGWQPKRVVKRVSTGFEDMQAFFDSEEEYDVEEEKENKGSPAFKQHARRQSVGQRRKSIVSIVEPEQDDLGWDGGDMDMVSPSDETAVNEVESAMRQPRRHLDFESPAGSSVARSTHHRMAKLAKSSMASLGASSSSARGNSPFTAGAGTGLMDDLPSPISASGMSPGGMDDFGSMPSPSMMSPPAPRTPGSGRRATPRGRKNRASSSSTPSGSSVLGVRRRGQVDATSSPSTPDASFSMISGETSSGEDSDDDDFVPDSFVDDDHDNVKDVTMTAVDSLDNYDPRVDSPALYIDEYGRRRSSRRRVAPTAFWKGERVVYERTNTGRRLQDVIRVETPDRASGKPKNKRRKIQIDDVTDPVLVRSRDKSEYEEDCIRVPAELGQAIMKGKKNPNRHFTVRTAWEEPDHRIGFLELNAGCTTGLLHSNNYLEVFHVLRGDFEFMLHHSTVHIGPDCVVKVPPFNKYKFKFLGEGRSTGKLAFTKICVDEALELDATEMEESVLADS